MAYRNIRNKDANGNIIAAETTAEQVKMEDGQSLEDKLKDFTPGGGGGVPKGGFYRGLFEAYGAVYNEDSGFYELNGLTDITEEQMLSIYRDTACPVSIDFSYQFADRRTRTNFFPVGYSGIAYGTYARARCAFASSDFEVVKLANGVVYFTETVGMFFNCTYLKKIIGVMDVEEVREAGGQKAMFRDCTALVDFQLASLKKDISFAQSPKINIVDDNSGLGYMLTKAKGAGFTITLPLAIEGAVRASKWWKIASDKGITLAFE